MGATFKIWDNYISPATNALLDIGSSALQFKNLYLDGLAYIDGFGEDTDMGDFDIHSLDGLYGIDDNVFIDLGTDGHVLIQADTSIDLNGDIAITEAKNFILGTTTGTKIGTATSQLLGFYNATPVDQPDTVADPSGGAVQDAEARTAIGTIIDRLQELGLVA